MLHVIECMTDREKQEVQDRGFVEGLYRSIRHAKRYSMYEDLEEVVGLLTGEKVVHEEDEA